MKSKADTKKPAAAKTAKPAPRMNEMQARMAALRAAKGKSSGKSKRGSRIKALTQHVKVLTKQLASMSKTHTKMAIKMGVIKKQKPTAKKSAAKKRR